MQTLIPNIVFRSSCAIVICGFLSCSVSSLNVAEIQTLQKKPFDPPYLEPDYELNKLRIDIIRQTYQHEVNDSTTETEDVPYHILGFNLGNGMFYDLNDNLSFRIDKLIDFDANQDFTLGKLNLYKPKWSVIYKNTNDSVTYKFIRKRNTNYRNHLIRYGDSIARFYKDHFSYAIKSTDSSIMKLSKTRVTDEIRKISKNHYVSSYWKRIPDEFIIENGEINLDNWYRIKFSHDMKTMEIISSGKKKDVILYKIEKGKNSLYVYTPMKYYGKKIVFKTNGLTWINNETYLNEYRLKTE